MSTPPADDASHARFRRGASGAPVSRATPPPPAIPGSAAPSGDDLWGPPGVVPGGGAPVPSAQETFVVSGTAPTADGPGFGAHGGPQAGEGAPPVVNGAPPIVNGYGQPGPAQYPPFGQGGQFDQPGRADPFGQPDPFAPAGQYGQAAPLYETPSYEWMPVEADPGRGSGIASIAVGIFFGLIGLFIGIHSVRRSRSVGLKGGVGIAGIVVSVLSMALFGSITGSWIKYQVDLATQCSIVGPGQYYTSSGHPVTCSA